jgi:arginase
MVDSAARNRQGESLPLLQLLDSRCDVEVISAPIGLGQPEPGVEDAYAALARGGVFSQFANLIASGESEPFRRFIHDSIHHQRGTAGNSTQVGRNSIVTLSADTAVARNFQLFHNEVELGVSLQDVAAATYNSASNGRFALTIGGDHSVAVGSIFGLQSHWHNLGVIWVDAHGDFNTPATSPSGNFHGMPLAALCNMFSLLQVKSFDWFRPCLRPEDVVIIGARNLDPDEARMLRDVGIRVYSSREVMERGMSAVAREALNGILANGPRPLHLSFDIDALDGDLVPGTGTPEPDGLQLDEALVLCRELRRSGLLVGMDLVEINPDLEDRRAVRKPPGNPHDLTINCAAQLLCESLIDGEHESTELP